MKKFISQLLDFIDKEQDTQIRQVKENWIKPINERVKAGVAIANLKFIEKSGKMGFQTQAVLLCQENLSKFRVGTAVRISKNDPPNGISCEILEDRGTQIVIKAGYKEVFNHLDGDNWTLDEDYTDVRFILKNALADFEEGNYHNLKKILFGKQNPTFSDNLLSEAKSLLDQFNMNQFQAEAFEKAWASENFYMVQGPPGTGKTWLLAQLTHHLAQKGERVLITAFTHRAINNALRKIKDTTKTTKILKIGQFSYADDLGDVKNYEYFESSPYEAFEEGLVVGATPYALRGKRLPLIFDTIIFDEAGQLTLPLAIAAMLSGRKYVFVGDHQQMPPVLLTKHQNKEVCESIFERLFRLYSGTMLSITYRMNTIINSFPSQKFYNNQLIAHQNNANQKLVFKQSPKNYQNYLDPEKASIFVDLAHKNCEMRSLQEANLIVELINELLEAGVEANEIAVIAPFRSQGRLIRSKLLEKIHERILEQIVVDTVERIQGQEREVIFISLTSSNPDYLISNAEFYFKPNRLNVALTRAKAKRIVVGSSEIFKVKSDNPEIVQWIQTFKDFYESCHIISENTIFV